MDTPEKTDSPDLSVCGFSRDCVKVLDTVGKIVSFNDDGLRIMEFDHLDQVLGFFWPDLWPADLRALAIEGLATAQAKGVASFRAPCPTAKGNLKWWDVTIAAVPGPSPTFAVISRDITEQYANEVVQRGSLERLTAITESNSDALWDIDLTNNHIWWSEGTQQLFGYGADQIGKNTQWRHDNIHPHDRDRVTASMAQAIENGSTFWQDEFRFRSANGSYIVVLDRGSIIRNSMGVGNRFVGVMQDISARDAKVKMHELVAGELSHRVNNILAVISAIFYQSLKLSEDLASLGQTFGDRLLALASANKAIMKGTGISTDIKSLVEEQLAAFIAAGRLFAVGPPATVSAETALPFSLAINELSTNAVKYGALSSDIGTVALSWRLQDDPSAIIVDWVECGGPKVQAPIRKGLGSVLIQRCIPKSKVERRFDADGFSCTIEISLS
ncbi:PAS domain S-box protein [Pseudomonas sp. H1h]|uniref:PAS domain S-box protein n=1 Tax=Pseudomonas sp. H1h TaxID=1397280 RepID=UPI00046A406C|nr:PAS domain S-box protein [Pseudomonas sp. H1h]